MTDANASSVVREARQFFLRLCRRSASPATLSIVPSSATDAGAVAVEGRPSIPSTVVASRADPALERFVAAPPCTEFALWLLEVVDGVAPPCAVHELVRSVVGDVPAEVFAPRHVDPEGPPPAPLLSEAFAEKSSDAEEGAVPQLVSSLASVGTPGDASVVEHVEALVGSWAEPIPAAHAPNAPVAVATVFARMRESDVETLDRLASAFAAGPDVVGAGADPSGAEGLGCDADADVGALALVPGPLAEIQLRAGAFGAPVFELDAVIGSLDATVAGPAPPPLAEADPPAVEPAGSGRTSGCTETTGSAAKARAPHTLRIATTARSWSSFLIS